MKHTLRSTLLLPLLAAVGFSAELLHAAPPPTDEALTFHAGFDGKTDADMSLGAGSPSMRGRDCYEPGVFGQAIVVGETGATLTFPSAGNLPLDKGTVEMWVQPVKWNMVENFAYDAHHVFFRAQDDKSWFQIYRFDRGGFWCVRGTNSDYGTLNTISSYSPVIGRWVHLVTTWDGNKVRQYVNGLSFANELKPMAGLPAKFEVGDIPFGVSANYARKPQTTLIDDLRIYNRPLTSAEIQARFAAGMAQLVANSHPQIVAPTCATPPAIDGKSPAGEWDKASRIRGFRFAEVKQTGDNSLNVDEPLAVSVAHDATNLYLAFRRQMPAGATLDTAKRKRDADQSQDDGVVVELAPGWNGGDAPSEHFRFAVNLSASQSDAKVAPDGKIDSSWDPEWKAAASAENLDRVMEIAIPFAALGRTAPKDIEVWGARFFSRSAIAGLEKTTSFWGGLPGDKDPKSWGILSLRPDALAVQIDTIQSTRKGETKLKTTFIPTGVPTVKLFAEAPGSTTEGLTLSILGQPLVNGQPSALSVAGRINDQGTQFLETGLINRSTGELLWHDVFPLDLEKGAVLDLSLRPSLGVGQLSVSIQGTGIDPAKTPILIELINTKSHKVELSKSLAGFSDGIAKEDLPIKDLAPGDYVVRSTVQLPGSDKPSIKEVAFTKPEVPWIGNQVGVLDDQHIPEPWTPLVVAKNGSATTISCWGREFVFSGSPLPSQIKSQGVDLLASPAVIIGTKGGTPTEWKASDFKIETVSPAKVTFQGNASIGGANFLVKGRIEYDGMLWLDLEGDLSKTDFDQLSFLLPMRKEMATYRLVPGGMDCVVRNKEPWKSGLIHSIWFGNERVGISWFAESDKSWKTTKTESRFELGQTGETINFRVNLVSGGTADAKGRFAFGLEPTPMRPMSNNWRREALNSWNAWLTPWQQRYHGYPMLPPGEAGEKAGEIMRKRAEMARRNGGRGIPYVHSSMLAGAAPEFSYFGQEWRNPTNFTPAVATNEAAFPEKGLYGACPAAEGWNDFTVFNSRDYLVKTDMDGIYHDYGAPSVCANPLHGCDGGMPMLAYRDLHKRLYTMQRELASERGRQSWYMIHTSVCSGLLSPPLLAFADSIADDEQLGSQAPRLGADMFIRQVPLEYYRIRSSPKAFGLTNNFILNREPALPGNYAMCVIHDIVSQFGGPGYKIWNKVKSGLLHFGLGDSDIEFRGYWENLGGATITGGGVTNKDVLMSMYVKPGFRALAVMENRNDQPRTETLVFDWKSLGLPENSPVTDLFTGETIAPGENGYPITFEPIGPRYIVAGPMPPAGLVCAPDKPAVEWSFSPSGQILVNSGVQNADFASAIHGPSRIVEGRHLGKALWLDGHSSFSQIPNGSETGIYNSKDLTLSAWIKPDTIEGRRTLAAFFIEDGKFRLNLDLLDGKLAFSFVGTDLKLKSGVTEASLVANKWQQVTVVFTDDGRSIALWADGKLLKKFVNNSPALPILDRWTREFFFGKPNDDLKADNGFKGAVANVKLYNRALTPEEISAEGKVP